MIKNDSRSKIIHEITEYKPVSIPRTIESSNIIIEKNL